MKRVDFSPRPFAGCWWLPEGHSQTVFGGALRPSPTLSLTREKWRMPDGETVLVDRARPSSPVTDTTPTYLVLHGLEGSVDAAYVRGMLGMAVSHGWLGVGFSFRGCGLPITTPKTYHAGFTEDLIEAIARLQHERPDAPLMLCGFSLGGNVMLKMLGQWGDKAPGHIVGAVMVSSPFQLEHCAISLDSWHPMSTVYRERFLRDMRNKARFYRKTFPGRIDDVDIDSLTTFKRFDHVISARVAGQPDAESYWRAESSVRFLPEVRVPTLLINADDDPLVPGHTVPGDLIRAQPALHLSHHARGGHIAFVYGTPMRPRFFAEEEASRFLTAVLKR